MRNNKLLFSLFLGLILSSCEANKEDFGNECVYLSQGTPIVKVESSYLAYNLAPNPDEPVEKLIYVAGLTRSGLMQDPSAVDIEMEIDKGYVEELFAKLDDPEAVSTDELSHIEGGLLLPEDCYSIETLRLHLGENERMVAVPVKLNMEKVKGLNPYVKWILPAFKIKSSTIPVNEVVKHSIVVLDFKYTDARPTPEALPEDLSGWTNLIYKLPKTKIKQCRWWDSEGSHGAQFTVDGNKDINATSNRWVPNTKVGTTEVPWVEYDLGGTFDISGLKIYYMNEKESGQSVVTPRANCYLWAKIDGRWFKQEELLGNQELTPSYLLDLKNVTDVRLTWDLIIQPAVSYFMKVKEIEIYQKP